MNASISQNEYIFKYNFESLILISIETKINFRETFILEHIKECTRVNENIKRRIRGMFCSYYYFYY